MRKIILACCLGLFGLGIAQGSLWARSTGFGVMYSSYLPFGSIYNTLETENTVTGTKSNSRNFIFDSSNVIHYAPGGALSFTQALNGTLLSVDVGIIASPGEDNIIPDFPVRPFIAINAAVKLLNNPIVGLYVLGGFYFDFALAEGRQVSGYKFLHFMGFLRGGAGVSLKIGSTIELFTQVQIGIGLQVENISLESSAGNTIYDGSYLMVPVALFPELGIRLWF